jgi:uncharacterized protein (DUF1684 family)
MDALGRWWGRALLFSVLATGCADKAPPATASRVDNAEYVRDEQRWRSRQEALLREPYGWVSLIGLHWIELDAHFIGRAPGNGMRLPIGPDTLGLIKRKGEQVWFVPGSGVAINVDGVAVTGSVRMSSDRDPKPTRIDFDDGKGQLTLIQRGDRLALRTRHAGAPARLQFSGLNYWPVEPSWRISGHFRRHAEGKTLSIMDISGFFAEQPNVGVIEFERDGRQFQLQAIGRPGGALFVMFADRTSGHGSYPAGRYIDAAAANADGSVVLDFNRAYNPPCAFTPFTTCPLPPQQNRLDLAVSAGEKHYDRPL